MGIGTNPVLSPLCNTFFPLNNFPPNLYPSYRISHYSSIWFSQLCQYHFQSSLHSHCQWSYQTPQLHDSEHPADMLDKIHNVTLMTWLNHGWITFWDSTVCQRMDIGNSSNVWSKMLHSKADVMAVTGDLNVCFYELKCCYYDHCSLNCVVLFTQKA